MSHNPDLLSVVPLMPAHMAELDRSFTVHHLPSKDPERQALLEKLAPVLTVVQTGGSAGADETLMAALPKLRLIASNGVGVDAIDLAAAKRRGIAVTNTPGVLDDDVADLAMALMLMCSRNLGAAERFVRAGAWRTGQFPLATKLSGKKLGILGLGRIGKAIARRAEAFGMPVAYFGRKAQTGVRYTYFSQLRELAAYADVLAVSCPGGPETFRLVDSAVLKALGPKGILVNVARGSVVDEAALVDALLDGSLGGAALDVFENEPAVPGELMNMDNVVLAPHIGSATVETRKAMGDLVVANLRAFIEGQPLLSEVRV